MRVPRTRIGAVIMTFGFTAISAIAADPVAPTLSSRLVDGATTISGVADQASATLEFLDADANVLLSLSNGITVTSDSKTSVFTANLAQPLVAGQKIQVKEKTSGSSSFANAGPAFTVEGAGDWGRIRMYFSGGLVLASDSNFQDQSSLFLGMNMDKNWRWAGATSVPAAAGATPATAPPVFKFNHRVMWNTFFETRLTSVPESQTTTPSPTTPASGTPSGGSTPAANATTTTTPTATSTNPDTLTTFLSSRKSALLQVGNYFPILTNIWTWQNAPNAMFIAPLVKIGFIAPTSSSSGSTNSAGAATQPVNLAQFYNYYGYGARIGHMKLSTDSNVSPELISYLDVIAGRFSNLETLSPIPGTSLTYPRRLYRIAVEGNLKIPRTPLLLGFSANIGQNLGGVPHTQAAKDDLRFFFGTRFDVGKLIAKLPQF
jgi:hypothetical protein